MNIDQILKNRRKNLKISFIKGTGKGGQKINKTSSTCQIIDGTDGIDPIVIKFGRERGREVNKQKALEIWEEKIRKIYHKKPERTKIKKIEKRIKQKKDIVRLKDKKITASKKTTRSRKVDDVIN